MTWLKIDDNFAQHPKVAALADAAFRLHVSAMCYASRNLTDGFIPQSVLRMLAWKSSDPDNDAIELVQAGLWDTEPDGWRIHDYLEYNPSRDEIEADREAARERMRQMRKRSSPDVRPNFAGSSENVRPNIQRTSGEVREKFVNPDPDPHIDDDDRAVPPEESEPQATKVDPNYAAAVNAYEQHFGVINPAYAQDLGELVDAYPIASILVAFQKSKDAGATYPIPYSRSILANNGKLPVSPRGKPAAASKPNGHNGHRLIPGSDAYVAAIAKEMGVTEAEARERIFSGQR